jgi:hypothetical protein
MEEETHQLTGTVYILKLVANDVAAIFPYFLAFYLISLFISIFSSVWSGYFYWPALHMSVVTLALISLGSGQVRNFWNSVAEISRRGGSKGFEVVGRGATIVGKGANKGFKLIDRGATIIGKGTFLLKKFLVVMFCAVVIPAWEKVLFWKRNLGRFGYYKLAVILIVLGFSLFQGIYVLDFFVLLFGLLSVLFGLDIRISAGCGIVCLALCPILLAFNQNTLADAVAVYTYYFLVIAVFTGIGDQIRENKVSLSAG